MRKLLYLFLLSGLLLASCAKQTKMLPMDYFEGEVTCFGDTASFYNGVTGVSISMSTSGAYDKVLSKYTEAQAGVDNPLYIRFRGHLDKGARVVVVDSIIGTEYGTRCNPESVIAGPYMSTKGKALLILKLDYEYVWIQGYEDHSTPDTMRGHWGMPAASLVVLQQDKPVTAPQEVFSYVPSLASLACNDPQKKELIFSRYGEFKTDTIVK